MKHHRAERIARVIVDVLDFADDVRSVEALCAASSVGVAGSTFRDWCRGEGITAGNALDLARVLRAVWLAAEHRCRLEEFLDADYRTVRAVLGRGGLAGLVIDEQRNSPAGICGIQRYVENRIVVDEILRFLAVRRATGGTGR